MRIIWLERTTPASTSRSLPALMAVTEASGAAFCPRATEEHSRRHRRNERFNFFIGQARFAECASATLAREGECAKQDRDETRGLGVGQAKEGARIDSNELDEEAGDASEDEVGGENSAAGEHRRGRFAKLGSAKTPEHPGDAEENEEFVQGSWVDALGRGDDAVGKAHAPGERGGDAVVAVAGKQAANASDGVPGGSSG